MAGGLAGCLGTKKLVIMNIFISKKKRTKFEEVLSCHYLLHDLYKTIRLYVANSILPKGFELLHLLLTAGNPAWIFSKIDLVKALKLEA